MSLDRNKKTQASLKEEIKAIQTKCQHTLQINENVMPEVPMTPENTAIRVNSYIEGLRTEILNSNTAYSTDDNLLTSQFLIEMKKKTEQAAELVAFMRGNISDTNVEIKRMQALIDIANEAKSKPIPKHQEVEAKHMQKAYEQFKIMKATLQGLIQSLFPHCHEAIIELLGDLMKAKMDDNLNGYITLTDHNYTLMKLLNDMVIMTYINITSVKLFVKVQNIFGVFKVFACLIVIGGGIYEIAKGNTANLNKGFEGSNTNAGSIALALYSGLWAYDGWNSVTVVTEEIINPAVNVPLSISIAVPVITALYVFMNVAYMTVLSYSQMVSVPAVAVAFGVNVLGPASFLIPLGVAISTFGCAMSVQFGVTRVCYTAARGGHMIELFSFVNVKRMTPAPAVAFQCLLTAIFIAVGNIQTLIEFASWFLWFFYGLAMVALLVLRKTNKKHRPYRVPTPVPCFVLLVAIFLSVLPIVHDPSMKYLIAIGFIVVGVAVYTIFVYYKKTPTALLEKVTLWTQLMFESVPPSHQD